MKKGILSSAVFFLTGLTSLFATTGFSGETGMGAKVINKNLYGFNPGLNFEGFFSGQLSLTNYLFVRGEFSLLTDDVYNNAFAEDNELTKDTPSLFKIDELSATFIKTILDSTHTLTFFTGNLENIGTQQFITRRLGAEKFSSPLTQTYLGQNGPTPYAMYGYGGEYSITFRQIPMATALAVSRNNENFEDVPQINVDFRLASAFRYFSLDLLAGAGAPIYTTNDAGEDVFLLIDTVYFHTGFDVLLGNKYSPLSIFGQVGFEYLPVKSTDKAKELEIEDVYLLAEPRFRLEDLSIFFTAYSIPQAQVSKMLFIEETLGANVRIFCDTLCTSERNYTFGINGNAGFAGKNIKNYKDDDLKDVMSVKISPFAEIEAMGGKLMILFQTNVTNIKDKKPEAVKFFLGYKKEL